MINSADPDPDPDQLAPLESALFAKVGHFILHKKHILEYSLKAPHRGHLFFFFFFSTGLDNWITVRCRALENRKIADLN